MSRLDRENERTIPFFCKYPYLFQIFNGKIPTKDMKFTMKIVNFLLDRCVQAGSLRKVIDVSIELESSLQVKWKLEQIL